MKKNKFGIVMDRSSSMSAFTADALNALNSNLSTIMEGQRNFPDQKSFVTLVTFADHAEVERSNTPVERLSLLSRDEYRPHGNTALLDAVEVCCREMVQSSDDDETSYVVIVITDGEENMSRFVSKSAFKQLLKNKDKDGRWTFAFALPKSGSAYRSYKTNFVEQYGVPADNCTEWETTAAGARTMGQTVNNSISSYYTQRNANPTLRSTKTFFADLSGVSSKDLAKQLDDITSKCKVVTIAPKLANMQIRDAVEALEGQYLQGRWYYELLKSEKVQPQKRIVIRDLSTMKMYGGKQARDLLGLPDVECRLRPSSYKGKFEVYVQSTSVNRKVLEGQKLLKED